MKNIFEDDCENQPELYNYILKRINERAIYAFDDLNFAELISKIVSGDNATMDLISRATHPNMDKLIMHGVIVEKKSEDDKHRLTIVDDDTFKKYGSTVDERLGNIKTNISDVAKIIATAGDEYAIGLLNRVEPGTKVYLCLGWIEAFAKCPNTLFATVFDMTAISNGERHWVGANNKFCNEKEFSEIYTQERKATMESIDSIK